MLNLIATCAFGLEALVRRELEALGYAPKVVGPGRVQFQGDLSAICRANLWLRTADRVLILVAEFPAPDFDSLFEGTRDQAWCDFIPNDGEFPVSGRSLDSQLSSVPACQRAVKRAVVESLLRGHSTATLPETGSKYRIEIAIHKDQARLTIDTTGPSLHKRGYRTHISGAPLKETLAAALVQLSFWNRERPLIDPFCGSGTIPIEAALLGQNIAPGRRREFPSEQWPLIPTDLWREARDEADSLVQPGLEERILGSDIDGRVLRAARDNAQRAGVESLIHFQEMPFDQLRNKRKYGCVITNPPYGQRLGEHRALEPLYQSIPQVLRGLPTWSHFILTAYPNLERVIQRPADRRRKLYNGRIECTYYQFHGPKAPSRNSRSSTTETQPTNAPLENEQTPDDSRTTTPSPKQAPEIKPVFGGLNTKALEQADLFQSRLRKRARHLRRWPTKQGITCYRLYERDIPEIPLVVDRYEDAIHITEYERPHDRDLAQHADWLDLMAKAAGETLEIEPSKVFVKSRLRQRGARQHEKLDEASEEMIVQEGGLKFLVNLSDYVDTGLFLDHRQTRAMVRDEARQADFLNLFAYSGSFSVYAADGAAARTTTVDWTRSYLDWAERNMKLNGFDGPEHTFIRSDARAFLRQQRASAVYDLAVVDPPTFSNSKRTEIDWKVQEDHAELLNLLLPLMKPGGVIYFSNNFRRFKLDAEHLDADQIHEITSQTIPPDFRNRRIHRCWRITKA